ncbi:hypothetical protein Tco_0332663 [Tanacetum coccineum]
MLIMQGVTTQGEVLLVQLNFLDIGLLAGHPKSRKVLPSPQQKLNTLPYQDAVLKSSGCVLNSETWICVQQNSDRALGTLTPHLSGCKTNVTTKTLKELQDESVSE